jgi:hypothetical protein
MSKGEAVLKVTECALELNNFSLTILMKNDKLFCNLFSKSLELRSLSSCQLSFQLLALIYYFFFSKMYYRTTFQDVTFNDEHVPSPSQVRTVTILLLLVSEISKHSPYVLQLIPKVPDVMFKILYFCTDSRECRDQRISHIGFRRRNKVPSLGKETIYI